jgi:hypothetical protein
MFIFYIRHHLLWMRILQRSLNTESMVSVKASLFSNFIATDTFVLCFADPLFLYCFILQQDMIPVFK